MESLLKLNAEQAHRAVAAGSGNVPHAVACGSQAQASMGKIQATGSDPLGDSATVLSAESVLEGAPGIVALVFEYIKA